MRNIDFNKYKQYMLDDFLENKAFNLHKKRFYQSKNKLLIKSIEQDNAQYNLLSFMFFLYQAIESGVFKNEDTSIIEIFTGPAVGSPDYKKEVIQNWWASYFDSELTGNKKYLIMFSEKLTNIIGKEIVDFWHISQQSSLIDQYYNQQNIDNFIKNCQYKPNNNGKLGKVIFPNNDTGIIDNIKKVFKPIVSNGIEYLHHKLNPHLEYKKHSERLKEQNNSTLKNFNSLSEEEKITFSEYFLQTYCYYKNWKLLITEIKDIYNLKNAYHLENIVLQYEYTQYLNKDLPELLQYISLYKNTENDDVERQIELMHERAIKIKDIFSQEIDREIKVKNRYLSNKNNTI